MLVASQSVDEGALGTRVQSWTGSGRASGVLVIANPPEAYF
jgi:hypothetical protein